MKVLRITGVLAVAAIAVAGCGTHVATTGGPRSSGQPAAAPFTAPAVPSPTPTVDDTTGPVGTTFDVTETDDNGNADEYNVTLVKVLRHAAPSDEFEAAGRGKHLVGAEFRITGVSGRAHDDVNNDAVMVGTDDQSYDASFDSLAAGTNFNAGDWSVSHGQTSIGWASFEVPDGIGPTSIQWNTDIFGDSAPATWTLR